MSLVLLMMLALLVEALWETISFVISPENWLLQPGKKIAPAVNYLGVMAVGIVLCMASGADLFVFLGIPLKLGWLGTLATGIIISRGSNFLHDLVNRINGVKSLK